MRPQDSIRIHSPSCFRITLEGSIRHEAHVPAQPPEAGEDARFPRTHENEERPQHPQAPSAQGAHASLGIGSVTSRFRLESLTGDRAFQRLRKGRTGGAKYLSVRWRPTREGVVRVGIVVSGKVGKAVVRNRVRRRLREGLRELLRERPVARGDATRGGIPSCDMLIIARPDAATAEYRDLKDSLERALERSGLW